MFKISSMKPGTWGDWGPKVVAFTSLEYFSQSLGSANLFAVAYWMPRNAVTFASICLPKKRPDLFVTVITL